MHGEGRGGIRQEAEHVNQFAPWYSGEFSDFKFKSFKKIFYRV